LDALSTNIKSISQNYDELPKHLKEEEGS
jgi:hypothetical protein